MKELTAEELLFFDRHQDLLPLYIAWTEGLSRRFPGFSVKVCKTQISFFSRRLFACVSFLRVKKRADTPASYLTLTLGLPAPLSSDRVAVQTEPYPGRWTAHIPLYSLDDLDEELWDWTAQAHAFSERK